MKKKGLVGAVVSALCVILYYGVAAVMFVRVPDIDPLAKMLLILVPIGICGVVILVLVQRLRELKSDECDDLDKY
ncbi:MAG: hypothetical protein IKB53_06920 [Oscillospiraceae bacterium]|nr:hypothetical protein [Oscillospiraceae bacterium]